ncbi:hypothetical protein KAH94_02500 [bacterium]|nr:hypothetical protein [bacterium]
MKKLFIFISLLFFTTGMFGMKHFGSKNDPKFKKEKTTSFRSGVKRGEVKIKFFKKILKVLTCTGCDNV